MASAQAATPRKLQVFFIPFYVSSHMIPMVDIARLFAERGVESTVVVTPANAALIRRTIDRTRESGHSIHLLLHPFPSAEVGLPEGKENLGSVSLSEHGKIYHAVDLARDVHERILREHRPDAVVADVPYWWTTDIARELGIPRITFHGVGAFAQLAMNKLAKFRPHDKVADESEPFVVPGLSDPVELVSSELPEFLRIRDQVTDNFAKIKEAQLGCYGVVLNTFYQLEPAYVDLYRKEDCRRAWTLGPLSLCYSDDDGSTKAAARGGDESSAANECQTLSWLDSKKPDSVVFLCFGSFNSFGKEQMRELALGLEASNHPFLWVARYNGDESDWLPEGFEDRVGKRGMIVRGWAPQAAILNHQSTGVFVSHCGWNSVMECIGAGVPTITWPLAFEQFINERLLVQILKIGVRMWGGYRSSLVEERAVVNGPAIAKTVAGFMDGGDEAEGIRRRAGDYSAMARSAVKESGSSYEDLNRLIDELKASK